MNIYCALEELTITYGISDHNSLFQNRRKGINYLLQLMNSLDNTHTIILVQDKQEKENVEEIIIHNRGNLSPKHCVQIYNKEESLEEYDAILILSYATHLDILSTLKKENKNTENVMDFYMEMAKNGVFYSAPFYHFNGNDMNAFDTLFYYKQLLMQRDSHISKQFILKEIILQCIELKDFVMLEEYVDRYCEEQYGDKKQYKCFMDEVNKLLSKIKEKVHQKKNKCIIIDLMDSLMNEELDEMKYITETKKEGLFFQNAYTVMPWTKASYFTMFCKKRPVEENMFQTVYVDGINEDNSVLLQKLKGKMIFKHFGYVQSLLNSDYNIDRKTGPIVSSISQAHWSVLSQLVEENQDCVYMVHSMETHSPYASTRMKNGFFGQASAGTQGERNARINTESALQAVDEQLRFYDAFFSDRMLRVYMSDHGKYGNNPFKTVLLAKGSGIRPYIEENVFSYLYFSDFIEALMLGDIQAIHEDCKEYAQIEDADAYGGKRINQFMEQNGGLYYSSLIGKNGIVSKRDLFIRNNDGMEQYYVFPNIKKNQIREIQFQDRIEQLREKVAKNKNKGDNSFFSNSYKLLMAIDRYKERMKKMTIKAKKAINELWDTFPDGAVIAIRGGGEHTYQLLDIIEKKESIQYIVDMNMDHCSLFKDSYQCITPECMNQYKIDIVVISSYTYKDNMREELQNQNQEYEIIDIYDYFSKKGMDFNQPFYGNCFLEAEDLEGIEFQ